jgi:hypothetical protein
MTQLILCVEDQHRQDPRGAELICVCCHCQRERTPAGDWREHHPVAGERLTHGICPECAYELYPELAPEVFPRQ